MVKRWERHVYLNLFAMRDIFGERPVPSNVKGGMLALPLSEPVIGEGDHFTHHSKE